MRKISNLEISKEIKHKYGKLACGYSNANLEYCYLGFGKLHLNEFNIVEFKLSTLNFGRTLKT